MHATAAKTANPVSLCQLVERGGPPVVRNRPGARDARALRRDGFGCDLPETSCDWTDNARRPLDEVGIVAPAVLLLGWRCCQDAPGRI